MLATSWPSAFDDDDWWFEVKWDGYRCLAYGHGSRANLRSRRGLDLARRFPTLASLSLPAGWVIDGEVVAFGDDGRPSFSLLQAGEVAPHYLVFDVLEARGRPLLGEPLERRRQALESLDLPAGVVMVDVTRSDGIALHRVAVAHGLEGTVAKRSGSTYLPGRRSPDWRKIAHRTKLKAVVGGWLPGEGARASTFGSLLVGLWAGEELRWVGAVGSGFSDHQLPLIQRTLAGLERPAAPFVDTATIPRGARWVDPVVVVVVEYKEWTRDLRLRAPVFKGIDDTPAAEVTWEGERAPAR